jgi:transposase
MEIVGGLDVHRQQITYEFVDHDSGEVRRGRLWQPDRPRLRRWLSDEVGVRAQGRPVRLAMEGCTGWRFVAEEIAACGFEALVAEPAEVQARRGPKRRAKTDRADARLLRELLEKDELPLSWVPPPVVLEWRERIRLYKTLLDQRTAWTQRVHAELFQHGVAVPEAAITAAETRTALLEGTAAALTVAARQRLRVGYQMIDATNAVMDPLRTELTGFARHQPACRALMAAHFGVGPLISVAVWTELGDCRRFCRSAQVVRHSGLDISVYSSDDKRTGGHLTRQGPPILRWAIYEAGKSAARAGSPDRDYYRQVKDRQGGKRAAMSAGRKTLRRCYHTLRSLDPVDVYHDPTAV